MPDDLQKSMESLDSELSALLKTEQETLRNLLKQFTVVHALLGKAINSIGAGKLEVTSHAVDEVVHALMEVCPGETEYSTDMLKAVRVSLLASYRCSLGAIRGTCRRLDPSIPSDIPDDDDVTLI